MNYAETNAGRVRVEGSKAGRFFSFEDVEGRLVEALQLWRQAPDRERGWQHVKALWPDILRHGWRVDVDGEFDERAAIVEPRRPALTRGQVADMVEASDWIVHVDERDRKLVVSVLTLKARGVGNIQWTRIWERFGRGRPGPDGLRKRYSRAIGSLAITLSR
jgi:hypothetical protein